MAVSATEKLHQATCANAPAVVLDLLETDADANRPFMLPYLDNEKQEDDDGDVTISKTLRRVRTSSLCKATPIFMAVRNAYENYGEPDSNYASDAPRARSALAIIQHLINHGADVKTAVDHLVVCNIEGYRWFHPSAHCMHANRSRALPEAALIVCVLQSSRHLPRHGVRHAANSSSRCGPCEAPDGASRLFRREDLGFVVLIGEIYN